MKMKSLFLMLLAALLSCGVPAMAQDNAKSTLEQRAETEAEKNQTANARSLYIRAFEDYAGKGQMKQGVACGAKATALYYKENLYKEAFDLLRRIDQTIEADAGRSAAEKAAMHYLTTRERFQMYMKLRRAPSVAEQLGKMEAQVSAAADEALQNDLLYHKTIYYYTFGQTEKGNATFKEMAARLMTKKEYDKVDEAYQTLIANGRRSNNAQLVAQAYNSYIAWKDSVNALKVADETGALKKQIADNEAVIEEKDGSLSTKQVLIVALAVLAAILAGVLVFGAVVLLRYIVTTRKQKKTIKEAQENIALKAKFISNISAQLNPTLQKLDKKVPEVKALQDFSSHIQTLSELETDTDKELETEDIQLLPFCEGLMNEIKDKVKNDVVLTVNAPKLGATVYKPYVTHILQHLLGNAAHYTPEGGHITLDFKKRSAHTFQFLVSSTNDFIPEEKRDDIFKPFVEVRDLTEGDGLGLPICRQMAQNMGGDLSLDAGFAKGTRFVLDLKG